MYQQGGGFSGTGLTFSGNSVTGGAAGIGNTNVGFGGFGGGAGGVNGSPGAAGVAGSVGAASNPDHN